MKQNIKKLDQLHQVVRQTVVIQRRDRDKMKKKYKDKNGAAPQSVTSMYPSNQDRQAEFGKDMLPDVPEEEQSS